MNHHEYPSRLLESAVAEFAKLPGIGRKTALRFVLHLLRQPLSESVKLADSVVAASALITGSTLITRNIRDFKKVKDLRLANL